MKKNIKIPYFIYYPLLIICLLVISFTMERAFHLNFAKYGIYPHKIKGLRGILLWNFIHSDIKHLLNNIVAFFVLSAFLFYHYKKYAWKILLIGSFITGILTWLIGREAYHIGISGINFMLFSFLFFSGIFSKYYRLMAVSLIVVFLYGSIIWLMFPIIKNMSWEGHLSGFISGLFFSFLYSKEIKNKYAFANKVKIYPEDEEFLKQFDEKGNFIENTEKTKEQKEKLG